MAKLLVDVFTPGNGKSYTFRMEESITVGAATEAILQSIREEENDAMALGQDSKTVILSDIHTRTRLAPGLTLYAAGVRSGHRLLLV